MIDAPAAGDIPPALALLDFDAHGVATGHRMADPAAAQLSVNDLAATRGDGIFETLSVGGGHAQAIRPHLDRFAVSARLLDLDLPSPAIWEAAIADVLAAMGGTTDPVEGYVKLVFSRGVEGVGIPTGWAYGSVSPDFVDARRDGFAVVTLDRGYRHDVPQTSPWLLQGAKTLSYAVNRAAVREAERRGADDALFVSTDGYLLEGPSSTLLLRHDRRLRTPRDDIGILAGTTLGDLVRWAEGHGYSSASGLLRLADLESADAAWLVSSVRHAIPIRSVDGRPMPVDAELSAAMNAFLLARTG